MFLLTCHIQKAIENYAEPMQGLYNQVGGQNAAKCFSKLSDFTIFRGKHAPRLHRQKRP